MNLATYFLAICLCLCLYPAAHSQTKTGSEARYASYIEVGGCIRCSNKLISIPQPAYDPSQPGYGTYYYNGRVSVRIAIDEKGNVRAAHAVSGHKYFRRLLEKEALNATFQPKLVKGKPASGTGVIVYNVVSRTTPKKPRSFTISCAICSQKAIFIPRPEYPEAAKAVGATGQVRVTIVIDTMGNVESAKAVSGHWLLRQASEKAALEARFAPTMLDKKPVKVVYTLVYNFVR